MWPESDIADRSEVAALHFGIHFFAKLTNLRLKRGVFRSVDASRTPSIADCSAYGLSGFRLNSCLLETFGGRG